MCGITGIWNTKRLSEEELGNLVTRMRETIVHRGPDDSGLSLDVSAGVGLGFRRLSIIDLSPLGHQPMQSESGRYTLAFNGEVYNFAEMRAELEPLGHQFRGHSDTEVMLAAIEQWGLEAAVRRFVGMFAFALWDRQNRTLSLVRDRLGIKPLFYGWCKAGLLFGSELKTFQANPNFNPEINPSALALYFSNGYIHGPDCIYQNTWKLTPGSILTLKGPDDRDAQPVSYWSVAGTATAGLQSPFRGSDQDALDELDSLLSMSVGLRMVSDVPVGAFLSGGIDFSVIVSYMQAQSTRPVRTFSIGFREERFDEAHYAKDVANHIGTDHTELYVTSKDALEVVPHLARMYDEPFADASAIPTYVLSALTRKYVTVSLSGDGGDELFGGYGRYFHADQSWRKVGWIPRGVRRAAGSVLTTLGTPGISQQRSSVTHLRSRAFRAGRALGIADPATYYHSKIEHTPEVLADKAFRCMDMRDVAAPGVLTSPYELMIHRDMVTYLPEDILTKVDRATMAVSLEARVPLLDHRIVEFAWKLPMHMKIRDNAGKWALREVLKRKVPTTLTDRPKQGFGVPTDAWIKRELRDWAEDLLDSRKLKVEGYLDEPAVSAIWREHIEGVRNHRFLLWDILMFQAWLRESRV